MNYRDLIQLAPEQCEKLKRPLKVFSECDMERSFKKSQEVKKRTRKRGTFGLAEMERCIGEIWKALLQLDLLLELTGILEKRVFVIFIIVIVWIWKFHGENYFQKFGIFFHNENIIKVLHEFLIMKD